MQKKEAALEVNTDSDTSKSKKQKTDHVADSKLSDKDQVINGADSDNANNPLEDRDTQSGADDSIKGLDKTADSKSTSDCYKAVEANGDNRNSASDNSNGHTAEVNDFGKDITDSSDKAYMTDTEEDNRKTVTDTVGDNNGTDNDNTVNVETEGTDRKLSNIEKYNMRLTAEQRKASAIQAGIRSGEVRRERRTLGEELKAILAQDDNQEQVCLALFKAALSGNYKAFNSLRDTIGEMPTQKQEVTTNMTEGDRELLENVRKRLKEQNITK